MPKRKETENLALTNAIASMTVHLGPLDRPLDREDRDPFARGVAAGLPVQPRQVILAALVVEGDDLPVLRVEHRTSGAAGLRGRPVVDARYAGNLRRSARRSLVIEKLVVLKRVSLVLSAGIPDDINFRVSLNGWQSCRERKRGDA